MRITFVLPGFSAHPIGGFKIVYEYASRLQERGHLVTVVHPRRLDGAYHGVVDEVKKRLWPIKLRMRYGRGMPWFPMHPGVRISLVPHLDARFIPDGDAIVATAWKTASLLMEMPYSMGAKLYLIQGYETWDGPKSEVDETWKMPFHKIVIAKWLYEIGTGFGEINRLTHIPNGIDFEKFHVRTPIKARNRFKVAMLYHDALWKGSKDGLDALMEVKRDFPDLHVTLFGVPERGRDIPEWIEYVREPSPERLKEIYNAAAVFLQPSWTEGWGLTSAEAMACGCSVVSTENQGIIDFAEHGKTALLSPAKSPHALANNLRTVLTDENLRVELASSGSTRIREFTWERSVSRFEEVLKGSGAISQTIVVNK